jgi:hypothetical protein
MSLPPPCTHAHRRPCGGWSSACRGGPVGASEGRRWICELLMSLIDTMLIQLAELAEVGLWEQVRDIVVFMGPALDL